MDSEFSGLGKGVKKGWQIGVGNYQQGRSADWILWQCLTAVVMRIIIVWLIERTGKSILIAVLFHTMFNVSWALFPVAGSFYDPFVTFSILSIIVSAMIILYFSNIKHKIGIL